MKETKNVTLRLPIEVAEYLDKKGKGSVNQGVMATVNQLRLHERHADDGIRGKFSPNEWEFFADSMNGLNAEGLRFSTSALAVHCQDAETYNHMASKWNVSLTTLLDKIAALTPAEVDAIYRRVERYWDEQPDMGKWSNY